MHCCDSDPAHAATPLSKSAANSLGTVLHTLRKVVSHLWIVEARMKGVRIHGNITLAGRPIISLAPGSEMTFGDGVVLNSAVRANPLSNSQPCVLRTMAPRARLILGEGVGISGSSICAMASIEIGEGSILGSGAMLIDNDFHSPGPEWTWGPALLEDARPIRVGRGVFIGARAIVLKGVTLGDRCIVGAGAVVTKDVPPGGRAVGNPARIISPAEVAPILD
jgi:acetyltransferase-like isoleucine patch superfamily enzyme